MDIEEIEHRNSEVKNAGGAGGGWGVLFYCRISMFYLFYVHYDIMTHIYMSGSSIGSHAQDIYMFNTYTCPKKIYMYIYIYTYIEREIERGMCI